MLNIRFRDVGNTEFVFHHQKGIAPAIGAAAISAGASLLGGLFGHSSSNLAKGDEVPLSFNKFKI